MCRGVASRNVDEFTFPEDLGQFKPYDVLDQGFDYTWALPENNAGLIVNPSPAKPKDIKVKVEALTKSSSDEDKKDNRKTSYEIFMSYYDAENRDAAGIVGFDCFNEWIGSRSKEYKKPEEGFRKAITAHITKTCGRQAFPPEVEADLLQVIRQKKPWPCALQLGISLGSNGFRSKGFHEMNGNICPSNKRPAESVEDVEQPALRKQKLCDSDNESFCTDEVSGVSCPSTPDYLDCMLQDIMSSEDQSIDDRTLDYFVSSLDEFDRPMYF